MMVNLAGSDCGSGEAFVPRGRISTSKLDSRRQELLQRNPFSPPQSSQTLQPNQVSHPRLVSQLGPGGDPQGSTAAAGQAPLQLRLQPREQARSRALGFSKTGLPSLSRSTRGGESCFKRARLMEEECRMRAPSLHIPLRLSVGSLGPAAEPNWKSEQHRIYKPALRERAEGPPRSPFECPWFRIWLVVALKITNLHNLPSWVYVRNSLRGSRYLVAQGADFLHKWTIPCNVMRKNTFAVRRLLRLLPPF